MSSPTAAEMVEKLEPLLTDALDKGRWADSEGLQNQLDGYREQSKRDADQALINELTAQLLDAKRNEERAVGDMVVAKDGLIRAIAERNYENTRKLDAVQVADAMRTTMDAAKAQLLSSTRSWQKSEAEAASEAEATEVRLELKLGALREAVRAVQECPSDRLKDELYALVPGEWGVMPARVPDTSAQDRANLHTLEAAVRAVRESVSGLGFDATVSACISELYALVPDGSEGES